jgi:hypothetical protein
MINSHRVGLYSSLVWLLSAVVLLCYCLLGLLHIKLPGVEEFVVFISSINSAYILIGVSLAIFIEGLYIVGTFFPGSTMVAVIVMVSQGSGPFALLVTILTVFLGWSAAGVANIYFARLYRKKYIGLLHDEAFSINDKPWTTWFPAFRSNYEVAQVVDGGNPGGVFMSSTRVKLYACIGLLVAAYIIPRIININEVSNEEGFLSLLIIAVITLVVGLVKLRKALIIN